MGMIKHHPNGSTTEWAPEAQQPFVPPPSDVTAGLPWWAKFIVVIGVPSAIAIGLVWSDRMQLYDAVHMNRMTLSSMVVTDAAHDLKVDRNFEALRADTMETNRILIATCVNSATTSEQRDRCVGRR